MKPPLCKICGIAHWSNESHDRAGVATNSKKRQPPLPPPTKAKQPHRQQGARRQ